MYMYMYNVHTNTGRCIQTTESAAESLRHCKNIQWNHCIQWNNLVRKTSACLYPGRYAGESHQCKIKKQMATVGDNVIQCSNVVVNLLVTIMECLYWIESLQKFFDLAETSVKHDLSVLPTMPTSAVCLSTMEMSIDVL